MSKRMCPKCGRELKAVTYPADSYLNRDQWDSERAGDWYCDNCPSEVARSGFSYFWEFDFKKELEPESELSTWKARAEKAEWENKVLSQDLLDAKAERDTLKARCEKLEGYALLIVRLHQKIDIYTEHDASCPIHEGAKCHCGLANDRQTMKSAICGLDELRKQGGVG
jgi:hypothetical protein